MTNTSPYAIACHNKKRREETTNAILGVKPHNWHVISNEERTDERERYINLGKDDYRVSIHLEAGSHVNAFLAHWYTSSRSDAVYPPDFPSGSVNQYHFGKATTCERNLEDFLTNLTACFERLK